MTKVSIPQEEFIARIEKLRAFMKKEALDVLLVYGDEYRKENLRYVSNFWPIFERGALLISAVGEPVLLCAPEDEQMAKEATIWTDIRVVPDFKCVTVSDDIDYPFANYVSFSDLAAEMRARGPIKRLGLAGMIDISAPLLKIISDAFACEVVSADDILFTIRKVKSENEIACLRVAAHIAEIGFRAMMDTDIIGHSERYAAGIAEGEARKAGAEAVIFTVFGSGDRSAKIVGRPENKLIEDGDMIMCALAIQYEGYVATCEFPYAVGNYSAETKHVLDVLIKAQNAGLEYLKPGVPMKKFVRAVRDYFREAGLSEYDVYPPLHGIGCAEAESPYPDENTEACFEVGMTFNTDISLFGLEGGSNRIEESFVITENGAESFYPFMRESFTRWIAENP